MDKSAACQDLANRFKTKAAAGLLDVKFYIQNREEAGPEEVCHEVVGLYEAIDAGKAEALDLGDFDWK